MSRRTRLSAIVCLLLAAVPQARAAAANCTDRLSEAEAAAVGGREMPGVRYECLQLDSGRWLWLGEAGRADGAAVLLVHGLGDNAHRDWRNVVPVLAERFRVIAIDLPGFGASEALPGPYTFEALAATLDEVLRRRQITRAAVVGHSLGGALALHYAWAYPQGVQRLILVDTAGILQESVLTRHLAQLNSSTSFLRSRVNDVGLGLLRRLDGRFDFSAWLDRNPAIRAALLGNHPQVEAAIGLALQDFAPAIRDTQAETTLIWGRDDPVAPLRTGVLLAGRMRHAELHVLDGIGHVPMVAAPQLFNALLSSALTQAQQAAQPAAAPAASQGDVVCKSRSNVRYTGRFRSLRLDNCSQVTIQDAELGRLQIDHSTATLENVRVTSTGTALHARGSTITGTVLHLQGTIAVRADESELDLAGATLQASRQAAYLSSSARIYFSVSDVRSPRFAGDVHGIWTRQTAR